MGVLGGGVLLVIGGGVGWLVKTYLVKKPYPGEVWGAIIAGVIGSWLGTGLLGVWGLMLDGVNIVASIIGALLVGYAIGSLGQEEKGEEDGES
ncbi:MAG: GlsB/YeaQ/YmgE family stress response membrane protein [Limnochordia bacterium]|jgi:uncharacterized membrane protein YeaQ/YmgE (transglycosylase-associated protein family)